MMMIFTPPPFFSLSPSSRFVGVTSLMQTSAAIAWPIGTKTGDVAIVIMVGNSAPVLSGWTDIGGDGVGPAGSAIRFAFKVLTSGDISSPQTQTAPAAGAYYIAVYTGGTSVSKRSTAGSTTTSVTVPGFVKTAEAKTIIGVVHDQDPANLPTPPAGFTFRATGVSTYFVSAFYDLSAADYANGSSVTFNLIQGSGYLGRGTLLEFV